MTLSRELKDIDREKIRIRRRLCIRWEEARTYRGDVGTAEILVGLQASQSSWACTPSQSLDPLFIQYSLGAFHSSHNVTISLSTDRVKRGVSSVVGQFARSIEVRHSRGLVLAEAGKRESSQCRLLSF